MSQGTLGIQSVKSYLFYFDENVKCILEQDNCKISIIGEVIIIKALVLLNGAHEVTLRFASSVVNLNHERSLADEICQEWIKNDEI